MILHFFYIGNLTVEEYYLLLFPLFHFPLFGTEEISYRKNQNVWDESNVFHPLFTAEQDALFTAESTASFLEFPFCFHLVQLNTASFSLPGIAL